MKEREKNPSPLETSSIPVISLMKMASRINSRSRYLAIEENFLLAAIHVAAMKDIPFAEGTLPDLPSDLPSLPAR